MPKNLTEQVLNTIRNYGMLKKGDVVMVAVSGGPDSVFLLRALYSLRKKLGIKELVVCNLDHGLRGIESKEDSDFVKDAAASLGLRYFHKKIDLSKKVSKKLSVEEMAREERYKFFHDAARKYEANVVATGHTLDDQAETVLMRIIKGASLKGVVGVYPVRQDKGLRIIRPLMELEKHDIVTYLNAVGISYRIDRTNAEPIYFRNIVRSEIMPYLEKYNPRIKRVLFNLAEHLREDFEFIENEKHKVRNIAVLGKSGAVEVSLKDIAVQPGAIQKEILRDSLEKAGGEVKKLSFRHWKEIENLIKHKRRGSSVHLPGGVSAKRTEKSIIFSLI